MVRGHLLGKQLGGSGTDRRNLVPLYTGVNSPYMRDFENEVATRIKGGDTIWYSTQAHYAGDNPISDSLSQYDNRGIRGFLDSERTVESGWPGRKGIA